MSPRGGRPTSAVAVGLTANGDTRLGGGQLVVGVHGGRWFEQGFVLGAWNFSRMRSEEVEAIALAGGEPARELVLVLLDRVAAQEQPGTTAATCIAGAPDHSFAARRRRDARPPDR